MKATQVVEREKPQMDSNPDLCVVDEVLPQLSYQANWEMVIMWVDDNLVEDGYIYLLCCAYVVNTWNPRIWSAD